MPYDFCLYLVRFVDDDNVFRFPANNRYLPGLYHEGDFGSGSGASGSSGLTEEGQQWLARASGFPGDPAAFTVAETFEPDLVLDDDRRGQLVLVTCADPVAFAPKDSLTFAEMIRALPKDKSRIAYIKALQWFNMDRDYGAVEMDDEIKNRLKAQLEEQNGES